MSSKVRNPVIVTNPWMSSAPKSDNNLKTLKNMKKAWEMKFASKNKSNSKVRPQRLTKKHLTAMYAAQLLPLYPSLTKSNILAALNLADNNLHEARLILDFKLKVFNLKHGQSQSRSYYSFGQETYSQTMRRSFTSSQEYLRSSTFSTTKSNNHPRQSVSMSINRDMNNDSFLTICQPKSVNVLIKQNSIDEPIPLNQNNSNPYIRVLQNIPGETFCEKPGTMPILQNILETKVSYNASLAKYSSISIQKNGDYEELTSYPPGSSNASSSSNRMSSSQEHSNYEQLTVSSTSSKSSVYDFVDFEPELKAAKTWLQERRLGKENIKNNGKIGIVITKGSNGYTAAPL